MRIALSVIVCFISAVIFSLSAKADYSNELSLYDRCKKQYTNGSCESVPLFTKRSIIEKFSACPLPADVAMTIESSSPGAGCANVSSISKKCADSFQRVVAQQSANHCARVSQREQQQQQAAASAGKSGGSSNSGAKSKGDSNLDDLGGVIKGVGAPLAAAFAKNKESGTKSSAGNSPASTSAANNVTAKQPAAAVSPTVAKAAVNAQVAPAAVQPTAQAGMSQAAVPAAANQATQVTSNTKDNPKESVPTNQADTNMDAKTAGEIKAKAQTAIPAEAAVASAALGPVATPAINKLLGGAKNPEVGAEAAVTGLTSAAEAMDIKLRAAGVEAQSLGTKLVTGEAVFAFTNTALQALSKQILAYVDTGKKACIKTSEAAGFLCLEGTSPGMQAARTVMDVAGPALGLINSAQKSCSTTAKVTRMVGTAMTIAKAACVGTKLACDGSCLVATTQLKAIATQVTGLQAAIAEDMVSAMEYCGSLPLAAFIACEADAFTKQPMAQAEATKLLALIEMEATPVTPGTSQFTALKCKSHMKDIALMGLNILGALKAQKNANACAEQLKAGDGATVAEYCSQPANGASSYCKCQKDNTQLGCTGYVATSTSVDGSTTPNDGKSSDQRLNAGGASGFAGPGVGGAEMNLGTVKSPLSGEGSGAAGFGGAAKDSTATAGGNYGANAGAGAKGTSGKNTELGNTAETEKKKWSFGAFNGSFGGGSSGGSGKNAAGSAGRLGQKDLDVQRAIASEKFRAEVSEASGRSNWEKVRESYLRKSSSLIGR